MTDPFDERKARAAAWFRQLRDDIVAAFEDLEDRHHSADAVGRFDVSQTKRHSEDGSDAGGGLMSVMRGGRSLRRSVSMCPLCMAHWARAP